jgi:hypothetical protein
MLSELAGLLAGRDEESVWNFKARASFFSSAVRLSPALVATTNEGIVDLTVLIPADASPNKLGPEGGRKRILFENANVLLLSEGFSVSMVGDGIFSRPVPNTGTGASGDGGLCFRTGNPVSCIITTIS